MIDDKVLDEILPVPDINDLRDEKVTELQEAGFSITNFSSGGIFYTLLMIVLQVRIEIIKLLRTVLNNMFVSHAEGVWMKLKAADFSKKQKEAIKTQGQVIITRGSSAGAVKISKGHVFKTVKDVNGDELRYFVLEETILQMGMDSVLVPIEAELEGSNYNVPEGQITRSLTYLDGGCTVSNESGWITREGSDIEEINSLRSRTLSSWSELATRPIAEKYKTVSEAVPGVLFSRVNDRHPRGQGTVDIIITSTAGEATEGLLNLVKIEIDKIKGSYDDVLVMSSMVVVQPVTIIVKIPTDASDEGIVESITAAITQVMSFTTDREPNELIHADIIQAVKNRITNSRNVKVLEPEDDVILENNKVIVLGEITVTIERI